jgi:hypothetical protein
MSTWSELSAQVEARAAGRCEYCRMHQSLQGATFHVEHIIPICLGGLTVLDNLALACPGCNLHKASRVEAPDPDTTQTVPLFNPRTHNWTEHFRWQGYLLLGTSPTGRATVWALDLNHSRRLLIRQAEELFKLFPP